MAFDGTAYHGWQVQPNGNTVQAELERALSTLLGVETSVTGAGRTDTGVHASFFIAHFDCTAATDPESNQFLFKLNRFLPEDIVIYRIQQVPDDLHARFSATYRTYHYHISTIKPLFTRNFAQYLYGPLNLEEIDACCQIIEDNTDFTSFSKLYTDVKTNICRVEYARWEEADKGYRFEIKADRFLRNMVRSLVGTLTDVGQGKLDRKGFQEIVDAKDRTRAGQSAPARGLFLVDIGYEGFPSDTD
jgi:tRNA pseudouridine38-40 synthase